MKALDKHDFLRTNGPDRYWEMENQTWMCRNLPKLAARAMDRFFCIAFIHKLTEIYCWCLENSRLCPSPSLEGGTVPGTTAFSPSHTRSLSASDVFRTTGHVLVVVVVVSADVRFLMNNLLFL